MKADPPPPHLTLPFVSPLLSPRHSQLSIIRSEDDPEVPAATSSVNRSVPDMPTGMEKEEEEVRLLLKHAVSCVFFGGPDISDVPLSLVCSGETYSRLDYAPRAIFKKETRDPHSSCEAGHCHISGTASWRATEGDRCRSPC